MPYIGQKVPGSYQATKAVQRFNGDGSDTTFTLTTTVSSVQDVLVSVDWCCTRTLQHTLFLMELHLHFTAAPFLWYR
jgi:hypothetical protein